MGEKNHNKSLFYRTFSSLSEFTVLNSRAHERKLLQFSFSSLAFSSFLINKKQNSLEYSVGEKKSKIIDPSSKQFYQSSSELAVKNKHKLAKLKNNGNLNKIIFRVL